MLKIIEGKLPKELVGAKMNLNLLAQASYVQEERGHVGMRNTKTRSEINRTTKKVYKQKGTGGARHGSRRANLFVGGGITFGPRAERRIITLSKSLKLKAREYAFSAKAKDISLVEDFGKVAKTSEVAKFLKTISGKRYTILLSDKNLKTFKFLRNLSNVNAVLYKNVTAYQIVKGGNILVDNDVFEVKKETKKGVKKDLA